MDNACGMGGIKCIGDLNSERKNQFVLQWLAADAMLERHPFQKLHYNERLPFMPADFVDRTDVGMVEGGRCTRLSSKPFELSLARIRKLPVEDKPLVDLAVLK